MIEDPLLQNYSSQRLLPLWKVFDKCWLPHIKLTKFEAVVVVSLLLSAFCFLVWVSANLVVNVEHIPRGALLVLLLKLFMENN